MSRPTKYSVIKQGWGGRPNFQHSHGLKMIPDDIDEGNIILHEILKGAIEEWEEDQRRGGAYQEAADGASTDDASDSESDASYNGEYASSAGRNSDQESVAPYDAHDEPETDAQHSYEPASDSDGEDGCSGEPHEYSAGEEHGYTSSSADSAANDGASDAAVSADYSDEGDGYASAGSYVSDDGDDDDYEDYEDYDDDDDDD